MMIVSRPGAKPRHALVWMILMFLFGFGGIFGILCANFDWPSGAKPRGPKII